MRKLLFCVSALALITGCDDSTGVVLDDIVGDDTGGGGTDIAECPTTSASGATLTAPYAWEKPTVTLTEGGMAFDATTCGATFTVVWNAIQTGVTNVNDGWKEEHNPPSTSFFAGDADNPPSDTLSQSLTHNAGNVFDSVANSTTPFNSDEGTGLTHVLRLYNEADTLTDCIAWGQKPNEVLAGEITTTGPAVSNASEVSTANCAVLN